MSRLTFHPPTEDAIAFVGERMRAADVREIGVTSPGKPPLRVLQDSVHDSRWATIAHVDGRPAIAYGVAPSPQRQVGIPWMLATDDLERVSRQFIRLCQREVRLMQQSFLILANTVHRDNALSLRWLSWCGFTIDHAHPVGPDGVLLPFYKGVCHV